MKKLEIFRFLSKQSEELYFLEDSSNLVFANVKKPLVYELKDNKVVEHTIDIKKRIRRLFTLQDGSKLVQTSHPVQLCLLDSNWKTIKAFPAAHHFWHGSWSIDQSSSGTIMYAEYTASKETELKPLSVWASRDNGLNWEQVLTLKSSPKHRKADIRHYHTCIADPDIPGRWYVSTGDRLDNNRLYLSENDGRTWEKMPINSIKPSRLISEHMKNNILRFTSCFFKDNYIYWPTDDNLNIDRALYVRVDKNKIKEGNYEVLGLFKENLKRNIIQDEDGGALTISESKRDKHFVDLHYIDSNNSISSLASLVNGTGKKSAVAASLSSKGFRNGTAYSLHDRALFSDETPGVLQYQLSTVQNNDLQARLYNRLLNISAAKNPLIVFFHAQRTAGTTLKDIFKSEYGEEKVYYQRTVKDFKSWKDLKEQELSKYKVYGAHHNFSNTQTTTKRPHFYLSIIRDPIERAVSLYNYLKTRPEHKLHELAVNEDLATFYRKAIKISPDYVSNVQTLRICGQKDFKEAVKTIEDHFSLVAPFERIDEAISGLENFFKFDNKGLFKKRDTKTAACDSLDEDALEIIQEVNKVDIRLYEFVKEYFDFIMLSLNSVINRDDYI